MTVSGMPSKSASHPGCQQECFLRLLDRAYAVRDTREILRNRRRIALAALAPGVLKPRCVSLLHTTPTLSNDDDTELTSWTTQSRPH
jgi:hypothetical protein